MTITFESVLNDLKSGRIPTGIHSSSRKSWFKYCYHFSHVENIVSILSDGRLLSRNLALKEGKMKNDNASKKVINQTNSDFKDYVRLYFRPKSPTQFHNEGFKTKEQLDLSELDAQCPVPVFLLLDIEKLLSHPACRFTETSLASHTNISLYSSPEEFNKLPFDKIYHDSAPTPDEKRQIIGHRHAHIIYPNSINLDDYLKKIVVRTPAEKDTLLTLMGDDLRNKYESFIQIDTSNIMFFSRWTYFHTVRLYQDKVMFDLRVSQEKNKNEPVSFDLKIELIEDNGIKRQHTIEKWQPNQILTFAESRKAYDLKLSFDNHLMYSGRFEDDEELPY